MNLTKNTQDYYIENGNTLLRETEKELTEVLGVINHTNTVHYPSNLY